MNEKYAWIITLAYLIASVLFILGIKGLTHPRTARRGNMLSALGMLIAIIATLVKDDTVSYIWIVIGLIIGSGIGTLLATTIKMTAMPQMVGALNGFGGGASVLVAAAALYATLVIAQGLTDDINVSLAVSDYGAVTVPDVDFRAALDAQLGDNQSAQEHGLALSRNAQGQYRVTPSLQMIIATALSGLIGAVTFFGSFVAFAKLQEIKAFKNPIVLPAHQLINAALFIVAVACSICLIINPHMTWMYWVLVAVASIMGLTLVFPIGGADMPVVVALLNSYSGLAAAATGFVISNNVLIIAGSLVGASGLILTSIMCKAMNRSLANVIFGKIDAAAATATADEIYEGKIKSTSADEIAMLLDDVQRVIVVPGYGMAVAQAQHAVRDLFHLLEEKDINVEFAVHPVAGRMPGHMNVLLAEVDIPYDKLMEMDAINPTLETVDVAIVLGANDVVNPDARENPDSPIAGMPIINVDQCRTVIVIKRSLSPGFAGIPNPLFANDNTLMFFNDGKEAIMEIVNAIKEG